MWASEYIVSCIGNSQYCIYKTQSKSDWLFNTQSRVLQADRLILENNGKATLTIHMRLSHTGTELASSAGSIGDNLTITIYVNLR